MSERFPDARVLHCAEEVPQAPEDHPDFWSIWRDLVRRYHPEPIDEVFASEAYGVRLAEELGASFVPVDLARTVQPVSGTQVRAAPWACWDRISAPARPWFVRTVSVHGPESSGKTTLAEQIGTHFGTCVVPEFGRTYTELFGTDCDADDIVKIARGQQAAIQAARRQARGLLVSDTDAVMSAVWSDMLTAGRNAWFDEGVKPCDLYILTGVEFDWVDDGTRYFADRDTRNDFYARCEAELVRRDLRYVVVSGDRNKRLETAVQAIEARFADMIGRV
ncbi:AAA family ATPase [Maricaulis sp.]|uniref:AAA family ATPase n=1 Tax=Maricaulis sp. TaxID=1486257 RepID=UPI003A94E33F